MNSDDHIKKLLQEGLGKFNVENPIKDQTDPRAQAPDTVPTFDELGYEYETNPVLKKRVEEEIQELKKKGGLE